MVRVERSAGSRGRDSYSPRCIIGLSVPSTNARNGHARSYSRPTREFRIPLFTVRVGKKFVANFTRNRDDPRILIRRIEKEEICFRLVHFQISFPRSS